MYLGGTGGAMIMRASNVTVRRRLFTALAIGTVIFIALILRLGYVQLWKGPELAGLAEEIRQLNLPGIVIAEDNQRYYPFGSLAAHVLGFTGIDNQGLTGVEAKYDKQLTGLNGSISYMADAAGRELKGTNEAYVKPKD